MTIYNDNSDVRKLESTLHRHNAYHPETKVPITCEGEYHLRAFNKAYNNIKELNYSIEDCIDDLCQVLLEINTHLKRGDEPSSVTLSRADQVVRPEFMAFVDFRNDLGDEDFEFDLE